ncbi:MAG TPA: zinc ribbon domain-containing protein [Anaeromyxobacter sp.]|nr:zinc ribbon domain-containing protein [Anaeromyxobacter sp.]
MPIYEYACSRCGKSFEELVIRRSDADEVKCPACGAREVSRKMSRPAATRVESSGGSGPPPGCGPVG